MLAPEGQEPRQRYLQPGVDKEAKWVKKGSQPPYGYQRHDLAEEDSGLVLEGHPTAARVHDGQCMASCLDRVALPSGSRLLGDTGYDSAKHDALYVQEGCATVANARPTEIRPWSVWEQRYNKLMARSRYTQGWS
jgi:transposase, IS5 family